MPPLPMHLSLFFVGHGVFYCPRKARDYLLVPYMYMKAVVPSSMDESCKVLAESSSSSNKAFKSQISWGRLELKPSRLAESNIEYLFG